MDKEWTKNVIFIFISPSLEPATVYGMNFVIFLHVTLRLFSPNFMLLLAPNPGDATVYARPLTILCLLGSSNKKPAKPSPARRRIIDDDDFINDDDDDLNDEEEEEEDILPPPPKKTFNTGAPSTAGPSDAKSSKPPGQDASTVEKDNSFREFRKLCADIANDSSHTGKTALVARYLERGSTGS